MLGDVLSDRGSCLWVDKPMRQLADGVPRTFVGPQTQRQNRLAVSFKGNLHPALARLINDAKDLHRAVGSPH